MRNANQLRVTRLRFAGNDKIDMCKILVPFFTSYYELGYPAFWLQYTSFPPFFLLSLSIMQTDNVEEFISSQEDYWTLKFFFILIA